MRLSDGKRYFTWDKAQFPDPARMQRRLWATGRRMVTIVDPHIMRDETYDVYREAREQVRERVVMVLVLLLLLLLLMCVTMMLMTAARMVAVLMMTTTNDNYDAFLLSQGLYVRNKDGREFEGWCWPGNS
jgi:alpha-glucosidase (family GH31 glycosyl hydrolase)